MQPTAAAHPSEFAALYRAQYGFVWRTLRHLGVDAARLDDAVQDTFLVVYRRLPEFAGRAALRTWLFEIARRVASGYRRSAAREAPRRCPLTDAERVPAPTAALAQAEAAELVQRFLGELDRDKAVVFVLAELEQWQAPEIAAELALNLNTVYSRLRAARKQLDRMVRRLDAREQRVRPRSGAQVLGALLVVSPPAAPPWRLAAARDPSVLHDMFSKTWSIQPVTTSAAAASPAAFGLSLAGVGLAAALALGASPPAPASAPARPTTTTAPATLTPASSASAPATLAPVPASPTTAPATLAPASSASAPATLAAVPASPTTAPALLAPAPAPRSEVVAAAGPVAPPELLAPGSGRAAPAGLVAPPPGRASPPRRAGATATDPLTAELALVESIRAALLVGDDPAVLERTARHQRSFADGVFVQEVAAAAIEARCRLGERERARRDAAAFVTRWPASPLAARLDALCRG